jgi:hypothetical protein
MKAIFTLEYEAQVSLEEAYELLEMNCDGDLSGILEFFEDYTKVKLKRNLEFLYERRKK